MAYCDRCGAYIPDGWTTCPACGYDMEQEDKQNQQAATQTHRQEQEKFAREEAEKRRAQRQAYDKAWAENEQRRRREEEELRCRQEEQEERSRRQQEEFRREQKTGGVQVNVGEDGTKHVQVGDRVYVTVSPDGSKKVEIGDKVREFVNSDAVNRMERGFEKAGDKVREFVNSDAVNQVEKGFEQAGDTVNKVLPILSYIGPLCFIPLILGKDRFTRFHAGQGTRLFIGSKIVQAIGSIFHLGWIVLVLQVLLSIIGVKNAINGEEKKLPYIG